MLHRDKLIEKIKSILPSDAMITDYAFEGANIVLYTKNKFFLFNHRSAISKVVDTIKKRVEVRPDTAMLRDPEETKNAINEIVSEEAKISDVWFDEKRSIVLIEAEKPGLVIGKGGETLEKIRNETIWIPKVRRAPIISSNIINTIRRTHFQNSEERRKFLNDLGKNIYSGWERNDKYWVRLSCLGGFREVGRSCMVVQTPETNAMLDCGVNVANERKAFPHLEVPEFNIKNLDLVIISHAHLDHSGFLPFLFKYGYRGPVYTTEPTRDIMTLLHLDYIDIAQKEGKQLIYDSRDIKEMVKRTVTIDYNTVTDVAPDIRLTFHNAGHIVGSAMTHLNIGEGYHNLLYTGDYKLIDSKLLDGAQTKFTRLETVISESTYGGKDDILKSREWAEDYMVDVIKKTLNRGGKILFPVLGVGRAQEVTLVIEELIRTGKVPKVPVFIDGMVWDITAITTTYPEFLSKGVRNLIFQQDHNPFKSEVFSRVGSQKERMKVIEETGPCIILATSGMLVGGPSLEYFRHLADNPKNTIMFVAYQGEGSHGKEVQNGAEQITIEDSKGKHEVIRINMERHTIKALSGHLDRNELNNFMHRLTPKPKKIIFNHGENSKCLSLASHFHKNLRVETIVPKPMEVVLLR